MEMYAKPQTRQEKRRSIPKNNIEDPDINEEEEEEEESKCFSSKNLDDVESLCSGNRISFITNSRFRHKSENYLNYGTIHFPYDKDLLDDEERKVNIIRENQQSVEWTKDTKKFIVYYKSYKKEPKCISIPMKNANVIKTADYGKANLIWKLMGIDKMKNLIKGLNKYQKYNHFPSCWQLGRKDCLWKNFRRMQKLYPNDFKFCPQTFLLPSDSEELQAQIKAFPKKRFIVKPTSSSRGRGIHLLNKNDELPKGSNYLISKYIDQPHLINNKKYDLRIYVLVRSYTPLRIYMFKDGLVRFASEEYDKSKQNISNIFVHLTNYSVNKLNKKYQMGSAIKDEGSGSKWTLTALKKYFDQKSLDHQKLFSRIKDVVVKTIISSADDATSKAKMFSRYKNNLFELYGFDVMIDHKLKPWLIEVNVNPSLNCDSELDLKVKTTMMSDLFNIVGIVPYSHKAEDIGVTGEPLSIFETKLKEEVSYTPSAILKKLNIGNFFNSSTIGVGANSTTGSSTTVSLYGTSNVSASATIVPSITNPILSSAAIIQAQDIRKSNKDLGLTLEKLRLEKKTVAVPAVKYKKKNTIILGKTSLNFNVANQLKARSQSIKQNANCNTATVVLNILRSYDKNKPDFSFDNQLNSIDKYSNMLKEVDDEFYRAEQGSYELVFPLTSNIEYYCKFLAEPGDDNIILWKWLKSDRPLNQGDRLKK